MATLQTSRIGISSKNSFGSFVERHNKCFSVIRQVGFASLYRQRRRKVDSLCIGRSYTDRNAHGGGFSASQDGSSAVEDGKKGKGLLLGTERDGSGSVVGFHLIPQSVTGDEKFMESTVRDPNGRDDVSAEIGMEDQPSARVTHNVVFVTAEASPYSKTGGLGDVCGSLPIALAARGHRVMVVSPRYSDGSPSDKRFANAVDVGCPTKIYCFGGVQEVSFFHEYREGVDWVFVDHPSYHRPGTPYGDIHGAFGDNQFRFTLLCHAACEAPLVLPLGGFSYGEKCLSLLMIGTLA